MFRYELTLTPQSYLIVSGIVAALVTLACWIGRLNLRSWRAAHGWTQMMDRLRLAAAVGAAAGRAGRAQLLRLHAQRLRMVTDGKELGLPPAPHERYRQLLLEHGHLAPGAPQPAPCGWRPDTREVHGG